MRLLTWFVAAAAVLFAAAAEGGEMLSVGAELWDRPRSGRIVLEHPAVRQAVNAYLASPAQGLVIHHASGTEPLVQAEELGNWLIALAIDPARIALAGDLGAGEVLKIEVVMKR